MPATPSASPCRRSTSTALDTKLNDTAKGGNKIRMGVEINEFGRPVAYWLRSITPATWTTSGQAVANHVRVPAEDILHRFVVDRPEQLRAACPGCTPP